MKKLYNIITCVVLGGLASCTNLPEITEMDQMEHSVVYIEEFTSSPQQSFAVDEQGGNSVFTPRVSNLLSSEVEMRVIVDKDFLDAYNKKNNTSFELLPEEAYDLEYITPEGKTVAGKGLDIKLQPRQYGANVKVNVKSMVKETIDDEGNKHLEALPAFKNYVVPVRIENVKGDKVSIQSRGNVGMFFLNRKIKSKVLHLERNGVQMWYKSESTSPIEEDLDFSQWTYQVFVRFDMIGGGNTGWIYFNKRDKNEDWGYHCLYGADSFTLFDPAGGKRSFNQKQFEKYSFEANRWYNLAMTSKDNEKGLCEVRFYVDGELAMSYDLPGKSQPWPRAFIGNSAFVGYVRDFRLWTKALSAGEIRETMWAVDPASEGLVLNMPLNGDFNNAIPGKEQDWIITRKGIYHFNDEFTFPE